MSTPPTPRRGMVDFTFTLYCVIYADRIGTSHLGCQRGGLRWFGHVEFKDDANLAKQCMMMQISGITEENLVGKEEMKNFDLLLECTKARNSWRMKIKEAANYVRIT